jgi:GT2 family glycosyltransferase
MDVSVIIVNYKTPALLLRCVQSIVKHTKGVAYEVVVVDNHSEDNSRELLEAHGLKVVWKDSSYNSGFARANNMGLKMAQGNYALLLNSDAFLQNDALTGLWNYYRQLETTQQKPGLLGCKIVNERGALLRGTHIGFPGIQKLVNANPFVIVLKRLLGNNSKQTQTTEAEKLHYVNHEADIISGACVFTNLQVLKEQSLYLDEDFFLYSEDVEWSYRYKKKGFRHFFTSDTEICHTDSGSTTANSFKAMQMLISRWLFIYKAYGLFYYKLYMWLLRLNLFLDDLFYKEAKSSKAQVNAALKRQKEKAAWNKYASLIPSCYTRAPSSAQNFLAYVE